MVVRDFFISQALTLNWNVLLDSLPMIPPQVPEALAGPDKGTTPQLPSGSLVHSQVKLYILSMKAIVSGKYPRHTIQSIQLDIIITKLLAWWLGSLDE